MNTRRSQLEAPLEVSRHLQRSNQGLSDDAPCCLPTRVAELAPSIRCRCSTPKCRSASGIGPIRLYASLHQGLAAGSRRWQLYTRREGGAPTRYAGSICGQTESTSLAQLQLIWHEWAEPPRGDEAIAS